MPAVRVIHIHAEAPAKPPVGAVCNGCGVCCLAEPCPVGMLVSRRRSGPCAALRWDGADQRYRCGVVQAVQPRPGRWRWPAVAWAWWTHRLIAAGQGCDAALEVQAHPVHPPAAPAPASAPVPKR